MLFGTVGFELIPELVSDVDPTTSEVSSVVVFVVDWNGDRVSCTDVEGVAIGISEKGDEGEEDEAVTIASPEDVLEGDGDEVAVGSDDALMEVSSRAL
jgi:hypothetical protein